MGVKYTVPNGARGEWELSKLPTDSDFQRFMHYYFLSENLLDHE